MKKYIFNVQGLDNTIRLDSYLTGENIFNSRSQIQNLIKKEQIFVNGEIKKSSFSQYHQSYFIK